MKKKLISAAQALVTIGLLVWIFRDPVKNAEMAEAVSRAKWGWLLPGLASVGLACLLQTQRWFLLLRVQGVGMSWLRTLKIYMVGMFFNLFLLGSTGGDVVKIYYAMQEAKTRKEAALLSVLVDRIMGLLGLVVLTAVVVSLRWRELMAHQLTQALLLVLAGVMGGMLAVIAIGFFVDRLGLSQRVPAWMPLHKRIVEFAKAFSIYARDGQILGATLGISVVCHICNFCAFYFAARALGEFPGWVGLLDVSSVMPIIMTITSLPVSLSGVGVREGLFENLFAVMFATPKSVAVPLSLLGFCFTVFWAVVGGFIYFLYRPSDGLHLREMAREVDDVERDIEKANSRQS